ncbi:MAG: hypothetical protein JSV54_03410 [Chloroflexota bacterium]|nr:MAG: hypothetical protein JSV54_03410 [Chloroflexota bacterium]
MKMQGADKSFEQIKKGQVGRENELFSQLLGKSEFGNLEAFEASSAVRRNELLFKIQTDMEDTKNALKQAEQLTERLRRRLSDLQGMYRILTKK